MGSVDYVLMTDTQCSALSSRLNCLSSAYGAVMPKRKTRCTMNDSSLQRSAQIDSRVEAWSRITLRSMRSPREALLWRMVHLLLQ